MPRRILSALVATLAIALCVGSAVGPASAQVDLSASVSFGDSLTHNELIGFPFRIALYGDDPAQAAFKKGRRSGDDLRNYAIAGSSSAWVPTQFALYAGRVANNTQRLASFISYEIGGNDVLNNFGVLSRAAPGFDANADRVIDTLLANVVNQLYTLYVFHPTAKFLVWTVPDVTYTPKEWVSRNTTAGANVRAHIARVNTVIRSLNAIPQVIVLDTETIIQTLAVTPPVIGTRALVGAPAYGQYDHLFADDIHPNAVANAILANVIIDEMNRKWGAGIPKYTTAELAALARLP